MEPKKNEDTEQKLNLQGSHLEKVEVALGPTPVLCSMSHDIESKEIKNIYIDCKLLTSFTLSYTLELFFCLCFHFYSFILFSFWSICSSFCSPVTHPNLSTTSGNFGPKTTECMC